MVDAVVIPGWRSIAEDFERTSGRSLELELESGPDGWLGFRVSVDRVFRGSFGTVYPVASVDQLVQLANDLCASFLDELVGGGWPICPDHGTHPMRAMVSASHEAVWKCPSGRVVAKIGRLSA